jgi:hypothetical protein
MKNPKLLLSAFTFSCFLFISCTKEEAVNATDNSPIVASASIDAVNGLDIQTGTDVAFKNLTGRKTEKSLTTSCSTVTMNPVTDTFPKTFYVDFGTNCITNGILRSGKLKITFSDYITNTNSTMTIERQDYYVNGNKVQGTIVYKNTTSADVPQWTRTVSNGIFTDTKGDVYLNSGTYTVRQTEGATTLPLEDNIYQIAEGKHTVTKQNGAKITLTVQEPIVKNFTCDYPSKGKLKVESTLFNGTIDYGTGECDGKATYTQNGIVFPITM